jgi:hypothetical protein
MRNPSSNITNVQQLSNGDKLLQALHQIHPPIWTQAPSPYHSTWDSIISGLHSFYKSIQIFNLVIDYYDVECILPLILGVAINCDLQQEMIQLITIKMSHSEQEDLQQIIEEYMLRPSQLFQSETDNSFHSAQSPLNCSRRTLNQSV